MRSKSKGKPNPNPPDLEPIARCAPSPGCFCACVKTNGLAARNRVSRLFCYTTLLHVRKQKAIARSSHLAIEPSNGKSTTLRSGPLPRKSGSCVFNGLATKNGVKSFVLYDHHFCERRKQSTYAKSSSLERAKGRLPDLGQTTDEEIVSCRCVGVEEKRGDRFGDGKGGHSTSESRRGAPCGRPATRQIHGP